MELFLKDGIFTIFVVVFMATVIMQYLKVHLFDFTFQTGCSIRVLNPQTYSQEVWKMLSVLQEYFNCCVGANVYVSDDQQISRLFDICRDKQCGDDKYPKQYMF